MIIAIDRGNGLTELIVEGREDENESVHKANEPDHSDLPDSAADILHRHKSAIKGFYRGRDGIVVLLNRLLYGGQGGHE